MKSPYIIHSANYRNLNTTTDSADKPVFLTTKPRKEEQHGAGKNNGQACPPQLSEALKSLAKAKTVEKKVTYSQVVKNLSESMGVFLNLAAEGVMDYDFEEDRYCWQVSCLLYYFFTFFITGNNQRANTPQPNALRQ